MVVFLYSYNKITENRKTYRMISYGYASNTNPPPKKQHFPNKDIYRQHVTKLTSIKIDLKTVNALAWFNGELQHRKHDSLEIYNQ